MIEALDSLGHDYGLVLNKNKTHILTDSAEYKGMEEISGIKLV